MVSLSSAVIGLNDGLALSPPLGWRPYNAFASVHCAAIAPVTMHLLTFIMVLLLKVMRKYQTLFINVIKLKTKRVEDFFKFSGILRMYEFIK